MSAVILPHSKHDSPADKTSGQDTIISPVDIASSFESIKAGTSGIGTIGERTLHASLKRMFEPDATFHEIKYKGYIADIMRGNQIVEIQTRALNAMRPKLKVFLVENKVTVVYPAVRMKWLNWIEPETGEVVSRRKSPKTGTPLDAFDELYKLKMFLCESNLTICLQPVDVEEYRRLDGWSRDRKKGSTRAERIPSGVGEPIYLNKSADYIRLIEDMPEEFTSADLSKAKKLTRSRAQITMNVMCHVGAALCIGKQGRANLYKIRTVGESDI